MLEKTNTVSMDLIPYQFFFSYTLFLFYQLLCLEKRLIEFLKLTLYPNEVIALNKKIT